MVAIVSLLNVSTHTVEDFAVGECSEWHRHVTGIGGGGWLNAGDANCS
jgi:hypothetical protein